jgi:peptidoglycan/xylan/chitin deacetylase (PgdA/CDA1 family)
VATGPATRDRVALTFHTDGDLARAEALLAALADHRAPMTAFVVGEWLAANPSWARRLTDAGHELANHTYTHPAFATLAPDAMRDEITRTRDLLVQLTGSPGRWFRPSGAGDGTQRPSDTVLTIAGETGYPVVLGFDDDPLDYQSPGVDTIVQRTLAGAHPGAIVSLHFDYPQTIAALPAILDGLATRGLTPVTVSTLLGA